MNLKTINRKAVKEILSLIEKQWAADIDLDYAFLQDKKERIYLANKEFAEVDLEKLRVHSIGIYFGIILNGELRLSIEGSELIGPKARKNIVHLDDKQTKDWLKGEDLELNHEDKKIKVLLSETFVILKHGDDFLGTGKYKENKILNFIPKERRLKI